MKKKHILIIISLLLFLSCSDDSYSPQLSTLRVTESQVSFQAEGGSGTVTVAGDSPIASVTSSEAWCTAQKAGDYSVSLQVSENPNTDTRSSAITIKDSEGNETHVAVTQTGLTFVLDDNKSFIFKDTESSGTVKILAHTLGVSLSVNNEAKSWLTCSLQGEEVSFQATANNTGDARSGYVYCSSGNRRDSILVVQAEAKDLYGDWYIIGDSMEPTETFKKYKVLTYIKVTLSEDSASNKLKMSIPRYNNNSASIDFNEETMGLELFGGMDFGKGGTYYPDFNFEDGIFTGTIRSITYMSSPSAYYPVSLTPDNYLGHFAWMTKASSLSKYIRFDVIGFDYVTTTSRNVPDVWLHYPYMVRADKFTPPAE